MTVAVLVVNFGSHCLVRDNLARTALPAESRVVVVDNLSSAEEGAAMRALAAAEGWAILEPGENLGFGGGMNRAAAHAIAAGAEELVLLNPDARVEGDGVAALAAQVRSDRDLLVSPLVRRPDGSHFASLMELDRATGEVRRVRTGRSYPESMLWVSGAVLAISSDLWQRVGGFDDDYFLYWEDIDLSVKVATLGGAVEVNPAVTAVHDAGATQRPESGTRRAKSATYYYYNTRNRLVFAAKHLDDATARTWRRSALGAAYRILLRGGRRQFLRPAATFLPALRGTIAGFRFGRRS